MRRTAGLTFLADARLIELILRWGSDVKQGTLHDVRQQSKRPRGLYCVGLCRRDRGGHVLSRLARHACDAE